MYSLDVNFADVCGRKASDIHFTAGCPPYYRIDGVLTPLKGDKLQPTDLEALLLPIWTIVIETSWRQMDRRTWLMPFRESDDSVSMFISSAVLWLRAMRCLPFSIPDADSLGIPAEVQALTAKKRGLVLVTGPTGSGKSTTLASLVDIMNRKYPYHIITIEDPIEYLHRHQYSMVNQREIGSDSNDYAQALRAALREDPDVILVGEMRDLETISTALTAAETGHLVLSTLHTIGADKTIDRIIDVFPPNQQQQVRIQLASVLECIISQQLIRREDGRGRVAALEVLFANTAIRNMIRENKTYQIISTMQTGKRQGMQTMDDAIYELFLRGDISADSAVSYAQNAGEMSGKVNFDMP